MFLGPAELTGTNVTNTAVVELSTSSDKQIITELGNRWPFLPVLVLDICYI